MEKTHGKSGSGASEELQPVLDWWRENGTRGLIAILILTAIGVGAWMFYSHRRQQAVAASQALTSADTIMRLESLTSQYPGTRPATHARIKLAKAYYDAGRYALALETYDAFLADQADHPMADIARLGRPHVLEAMVRFEEARKDFDAFATGHPGHYLEAPAIFGSARCMAMLDNKEDAVAKIEEFIESHPDTSWIDQARAEIEWVRLADPESLTDEFFAPQGRAFPDSIQPRNESPAAETNRVPPDSATDIPAGLSVETTPSD